MSEDEIIILEDQGDDGAGSQKKGFIHDMDEWFLSHQKLKLKDKMVMYRLLATMVNAGITVLKGLIILEKQQQNKRLKSLLNQIIKAIRSGQTFSAALSMHQKNFGTAEIAIIEAGEKTGQLNNSLVQVAGQLEKLASINKKLVGALIYPMVIVFVMFAVIVVIMVVVVPQLIEVFGDFGSLPPPTQALIKISDFMRGFWWLFAFTPFVLVTFIKVWTRNPAGKYHYDNIKLKVPVFGKLMKKVILSKFSRLMSNLLSSGITITETLRIISDAVGNEVYKQRILLLRDDVKRGVKIGESLEDDKLFPDMLIQMIKIGEETAKLDTIIIKISEFYDEEVDTAVSSMNKIIEPIIIVVMAVFIALIAYSVMTPIFSLSDTITGGF